MTNILTTFKENSNSKGRLIGESPYSFPSLSMKLVAETAPIISQSKLFSYATNKRGFIKRCVFKTA